MHCIVLLGNVKRSETVESAATATNPPILKHGRRRQPANGRFVESSIHIHPHTANVTYNTPRSS